MTTTRLITILCLMSFALAGQNRDQVEERIEARRIAFITKIVDLTPEEAQVFWPEYNKYRDEQKAIRKSTREQSKNLDADQQFDLRQEAELKQLQNRNKFAKKVKELLGAERALKLMNADRRFKEKMVQELQERRTQRDKRGPRQR